MRRYWWMVVLGILIGVFLSAKELAWFWTEWLWFRHLGYAHIFWVRTLAKWVIGFAVGSFFAALIALNLLFAQRLLPRRPFFRYPSGWLGQVLLWLETGFRWILLSIAIIFGVFVGIAAARRWEAALLFLYAVPSGMNDPVFGKDISFYLFRLPFWRFLYDYALGAFVVSLVVSAVFYGFYAVAEIAVQGQYPPTFKTQFQALLRYATPRIRAHLLTLIALTLFLAALGFRLSMFELLYGKGMDEVVWGAGYTDLKVRLPVFWILLLVFCAGGGLLLWSIWARAPIRVGIALVALFALTWLANGFLPHLFQRFIVKPNEIRLEKPYLHHNIQMTRLAYGIHDRRLTTVAYPFRSDLPPEALERNRDLLFSIRLWDYRALKLTLEHIQEIRTYYDFADVDIDRYFVRGEYRQVMLAARELNPEQLRGVGGLTWINRHLQYTHGYGVVVVPVNEVEGEGMPRLWVKDIPPETDFPELQLRRPEIYYGELTNDYIVVRTSEPEFDYPKGDEEVKTRYEGRGGVPLGSLLRRFAFALRFNEPNLVLTRVMTPESRILFRRNIHRRVRAIAPFLVYDDDPYIVIADGRLFWILDAYTISDRFPYSEPMTWEQKSPLRTERWRLNYIRNSIKVVIDAYHGTVHFYIADEEDPIIQTYARIFPGLFRPLSEMPEALRSHIRYPVTYFRIQAEILRRYHMTDPERFYKWEDVWDIAKELYMDDQREVEPYYVMMRLPDAKGHVHPDTPMEFILILPFTPRQKPNLVALLAARCDPPHYGQLLVLGMPHGEQVLGTAIIEARIDNDAYISQQLTLWKQRGSDVIRGNLLVIPLDGSLLYVEPLFLVAEQTQLPELKRVIVATPKRVIMAEDLPKALTQLTGTDQKLLVKAPPKAPKGTDGTTILPLLLEHLTDLDAMMRETEESARRGDWASFGEGLKRMREKIQKMRRLLEGTL